MKYAYEKLMEEENLKLADLPSDAKIGIGQIKKIEKAILMAQATGKKISSETIAKIRANDKWIVQEILDYLDDTDENEEDMPEDSEEIIEEIKGETLTEDQKYALEIENELKSLYDSGNREFTIETLRNNAKTTYEVLFDNYEEGEENGVMTTRYKLIETKPRVFTISKN